MATTTSHLQLSVPGSALRALWSARTWRATSHLVTGAVIGLVSCVAVLVLLVVTVPLAPTVVLAIATLGLLLIVNRALTSVQRSRFAAFLETHIPRPAPPAVTGSGYRRILRELSAATTARQLGYHLLAGVFGPAAGAAVVATWSAGLVLATSLLHAEREGLAPGLSTSLTAAGLDRKSVV